jgi:hypothetical protein
MGSAACLFDVMGLPEETLKDVLPKASVRVIARLVSAYPRSLGSSFLDVLSTRMSPATLQFLKEEIQTCPIPTYAQLRDAQREIQKIIQQQS